METIRQILAEIRPEYSFEEEVDFIEAGMLDSFDVLTLVAELEEKFKVQIDGEDIVPENFNSIASIKKLLDNSKGK